MRKVFLILVLAMLMMVACVFAMRGDGTYEYEVESGQPDSLVTLETGAEDSVGAVEDVSTAIYEIGQLIEKDGLISLKNEITDPVDPDSTVDDEFDLLD